jgi:hypothetical protein
MQIDLQIFTSAAGPMIDRVEPAELSTSGERLTLYGSGLDLGQVSVKTSDLLDCHVVSSRTDQVVVELGPNTGADKCLMLRNRAGLSNAKFSYAHKMFLL